MSSPRGIDGLNRNLQKHTWIILILVATLIMAATTVPDWIGYSLENDRYSYSGTFFDAEDHAVHVAMIRSGMEGNLAYGLRFTSEPHPSYYIRVFYIILGQANRILGFEPEFLFQLARWIFGYASLAALFMLCNRVIASPRIQWLAFFLAIFGSGAGILQVMTGWNPADYTPIDLWLIDAYMFFSLALFPHFAFTLALICTALLAFFDYLETAHLRYIAIVIISAILVQFVNPIAFVLVDIVISAAAILSWLKAKKINHGQILALGVVALAQIPLFAYNLLILTQDPVWRQFTAQNETLSPPPIYYILGFLFFWPPALAGSLRAVRAREPRFLSMLIWIAGAFFLAFAPFAIQRRFLLGITIPLGILAAHGLEEALQRHGHRYARVKHRTGLLMLSSVLLISITTISLFPGYALYLHTRPGRYFYPHSLDTAFDWISKNTGPDDLILGMNDTGRLTAQKTGRRVYLGHPFETLGYSTKLAEAAAFFRGELPSGWVSGVSIQWVVYGPYEQNVAPSFENSGALEPVYDLDQVIIYRVK